MRDKTNGRAHSTDGFWNDNDDWAAKDARTLAIGLRAIEARCRAIESALKSVGIEYDDDDEEPQWWVSAEPGPEAFDTLAEVLQFYVRLARAGAANEGR